MIVKNSLAERIGINRIRLEFKVFSHPVKQSVPTGINRIRLEFKVCTPFVLILLLPVLIESDWNLKDIIEAGNTPIWMRINRIRLEFKDIDSLHRCIQFSVLIESDWNLKVFKRHT